MTNSEFGESIAHELVPSIMKAYSWPNSDDLPMFKSPLSAEELSAIKSGPTISVDSCKGYDGDYDFNGHVAKLSRECDKISVTVDDQMPFNVTALTDDAGIYQQAIPGPQEVLRIVKDDSGKVTGIRLFGLVHLRK